MTMSEVISVDMMGKVHGRPQYFGHLPASKMKPDDHLYSLDTLYRKACVVPQKSVLPDTTELAFTRLNDCIYSVIMSYGLLNVIGNLNNLACGPTYSYVFTTHIPFLSLCATMSHEPKLRSLAFFVSKPAYLSTLSIFHLIRTADSACEMKNR